MSRTRMVNLVSYGAALVCVVCVATSVVLRRSGALGFGSFELVASAYLIFQGGVGAVIASRRPTNPIGWMLLASSLLWGASWTLGDAALVWAPRTASIWPSYAAWVAQIAFMPGIVILPWLLPLVFPDGRLLSARWRPVLWAGLVSGFGAMAGAATAGELPDYEGIGAPFQLSGLTAELMHVVTLVSWLGVTAVTLLAVVPAVLRYRRANEVVRLQLRWLLFSFGLLATSMLTAAVLFSVAPSLSNIIILLGLATLPAGIAIALLRHRLFDIDRLISRTVSYALVTAFLAASYIGVVLTLGAVTRAAGASSDLAVAVSTLVVAALFQPVRRWVQGRVDRRFNRRRYDAARIVDEFGTVLRSEVRVDALMEDLRGVVAATVSPTDVSVWVAPPVGRPVSVTVPER